MKKRSFLFLYLFLTFNIIACRQYQVLAGEPYNLNFEKISNSIPEQWIPMGDSNYDTGADSLTVHDGHYSAYIEHNAGTASGFKAWGVEIPGSYDGKQITLTGYIRTEGVSDGYAGLWMRIDPEIAFDNMYRSGVTGTTEWTQYQITLPMNPTATDRIVVGGLLIGKGKMWLDDLQITVDGKDISSLKFIETEKGEFADGSGITNITLTQANIDALKELGLIWGFLKYYHPVVGAGKYNWDEELFRILPSVLNEEDRAKRYSTLTA